MSDHGIVPTTIQREVMDIMEGARSAPEPGRGRKGRQIAEDSADYLVLEPRQLAAKHKQLEAQMYKHARDLEFEKAAQIRDEMHELKLRSLASPI